MDGVDNRYINAYALHEVKVVLVNLYVPPFTGDADYYLNPRKMTVIEHIFTDLDAILTQCEVIAYDIAILCDGNGRFGDITGDKKWNEMGRQFWMPRIKAHGLQILNVEDNYGRTTWRSKANPEAEGILDFILINENWRNRKAEISMEVPANKFGSDHCPMLLRLDCECVAESSRARRRFWRPFYKIRVHLDDEEIVTQMVQRLSRSIKQNPRFVSDVTNDGEHHRQKTKDRESRRQYINKLYNTFAHSTYEAMIASGCMRCTPAKQYEECDDEYADADTARLLALYERLASIQRELSTKETQSDAAQDIDTGYESSDSDEREPIDYSDDARSRKRSDASRKRSRSAAKRNEWRCTASSWRQRIGMRRTRRAKGSLGHSKVSRIITLFSMMRECGTLTSGAS